MSMIERRLFLYAIVCCGKKFQCENCVLLSANFHALYIMTCTHSILWIQYSAPNLQAYVHTSFSHMKTEALEFECFQNLNFLTL